MSQDFGTLYVTFYPGEKVIELRIAGGSSTNGVIRRSPTSGSSMSCLTISWASTNPYGCGWF